MSFNKRYLNKENIVNHVDDIIQYLSKPDAIFVTDTFSDDVYRLYNEGVDEDEIKLYIEENK
jgi:hypothetical protein